MGGRCDRLRQPEPAGEGPAAPVCGLHDGPQPGTGDTADRELCRQRPCKGGAASTEKVCRSLHEGGRGTLAYVDKSHGNLSGPATKRILEREFGEYSQAAYQRLAGISVAQIYRFRDSESYRKRNTSYQPTRPTPIPIGERRKPRPQGRPGYLRIDTVHQGDRDGVKGVYHINAIDELTQWEIVAAAPQISEHWLIPLLEQLLEQFPFTVRGFHSDNGSEFINYTVRQTAGQAAHRADQIARPSHGRQRTGGVEKRSDHSQTHRFRPHRRPTCRSRRSLSSPVSESLRQLSPARRGGRDYRGAQRKAAPRLSSVGHAVRDLPPDAAVRNLPAVGNNYGRAGTIRSTTIRHRISHRDAARQKTTAFGNSQKRVISTAQDKTSERGGNDGADGKARKTRNRFPSLFHRALGNRRRDFHIPTAPVTVFPVLKNQNERNPGYRPSSVPL